QTLLATLIAELPLALLACDVAGRMTHYNRAAIELFGIPSGAAAGLARDPYPLTSDVFRADRTTPVAADERPLARALRGDEVSEDRKSTRLNSSHCTNSYAVLGLIK